MVDHSELNYINELSGEMSRALGKACQLELLMRLIAERSKLVQDRLRLIQEEKKEEEEKKRDERIEKAWTFFKSPIVRTLGESSKMSETNWLNLFQKFKKGLIDSKCLKQIPKIENYRDCLLSNICSAITQVFKENLGNDEVKLLKHACQIRNSLVHSDFVKLMKIIEIEPIGREIDGRTGKRVPLKKGANLFNALWGAKHSEAFEKARRKIEEAIEILKCIATDFRR